VGGGTEALQWDAVKLAGEWKKVPVDTMFVGQITKRGWVCGNTTAFQRYADDMLLLPPEARVGTCYSSSFATAHMCTTAVVR
jgi:hypothetical protein